MTRTDTEHLKSAKAQVKSLTKLHLKSENNFTHDALVEIQNTLNKIGVE